MQMIKPATGKALIAHVDDIGFCSASFEAFKDLVGAGLVRSGSVMPISPFLSEIAVWQRQNPEPELGVHITLTSEWPTYRWGPVGTPSLDLLDQCGFLHSTREAVVENALSSSVRDETLSQLRRCQQAGLQCTHMDSHMYVNLQVPFLEDFLSIAIEHGLPLPITHNHLAALGTKRVEAWRCMLEEVGFPMFVSVLPAPKARDVDEYARGLSELLRELPEGLTCLLLHPVKPSEELVRIIRDGASRSVEYEALMQGILQDCAAEASVRLTTYGEECASVWKSGKETNG